MAIEIIVPLHNLDSELKISLFKTTLSLLLQTRYPVIVLCDKTIIRSPLGNYDGQFDLWGYMNNHSNLSIREDCPNTEWGKIEEYYTQSKADYIAICHADDFWLQGKLERQMKYIKDHPMVLSAYTVFQSATEVKPAQYFFHCPKIHSDFGIYEVMPSMWLINKKIVKELPIPWEQTYTALDLGISLAISQFGIIPVIRQPLMQWNFHPESGTSVNQRKIAWQSDLAKQEAYAKSVKSPHFQYVWE